MEDLATVKRQIKEWEHEFQRKNNKPPSKLDVKQNDNVYHLYKTYKQLKEKPKQSPMKIPIVLPILPEITKRPTLVKNIEITPRKAHVDNFHGRFTDDEIENDIEDQKQLGPTPQANGKILSLFDFNMTPPDSSPLKNKGRNGSDIFKTPTKVRLEFESPTGKRSNITEKLMAVGNITPTKKDRDFSVETPRYLSKSTNVSFESSPRKSPWKQLITPKKPTIPFLVSPSPLKSHRFTKKLSDVFHASIQEENVDDSFIQDILDAEKLEEGLDEGDEDVVRKRKKFTQKRTTRRWKIKPKLGDAGDDQFEKKDIHEEIAKISESKREELESYMKGESEEKESEEEESDSEQVYKRREPKNTKGMIKPMSNNYQRLKINDPRTKAFKRRMRR